MGEQVLAVKRQNRISYRIYRIKPCFMSDVAVEKRFGAEWAGGNNFASRRDRKNRDQSNVVCHTTMHLRSRPCKSDFH